MDQSIIAPSVVAMMDASSDGWYCKDQNSVFFYANRTDTQQVGYLKPEDIVGDTDYDMPCAASECAAQFQQQDQEVFNSGRPLTILGIHPYANDQWRVIIGKKNLLLDAHGQPTGGLIAHRIDITSHHTLELGQLLNAIALKDPEVKKSLGGSSYVIGQHFDDVALSAQETELLFFWLRLRRLKKVACAMQLPIASVARQAESLMYKFGATSKRELLDVATQQGYLSQIPATLFNQQLTVILREQG